jgi:predicted nucleic-acid-binding Zn-ribbon protein
LQNQNWNINKEITKELLKIQNNNYETNECKNIIYGKLIDAFEEYVENLSEEKLIINFIEEQKNNKRNSTKRKAEKILRKIKK